jgi:hypothetical protein
MKHLIAVLVCAGLVLASVLGSGVWAGPAIQDSVVAYGFEALEGETCDYSSSTVLEVGEQGNKLRLLLLNEALMVSEDSRLSGPVTVNVEVFINNVNNHVNAHGRAVLSPTAHPGSTWVGDFNLKAPGGRTLDVNGIIIIKDSQMNMRGTGEFDGQWFFFSHGIGDSSGTIPVEDPDGPGGCDFSGEIFAGTILNPHAT